MIGNLGLRNYKSTFNFQNGGLAQLARAPALHAGGHRFDSDILHKGFFKPHVHWHIELFKIHKNKRYKLLIEPINNLYEQSKNYNFKRK